MPSGGGRMGARKLLGKDDVTREGSADRGGIGTGAWKMLTGVALAAQDKHLSERQGIGMSNRHERGKAAHRRESTRGSAVQRELRRAAAPHDLDVSPQHAVGMARAERLHRRFFGGKPAGKMNRRHLATGAVRHLAFGEHPPQEPIAVTLDGVGDAIDICGVQAEPKNVRHATATA